MKVWPALPCFALPCPAFSYFALVCPALPCLAPLCPALPRFALLCPALPCLALLCPALPRFALLCCLALLCCFALPCPTLPCFAQLCSANLSAKWVALNLNREPTFPDLVWMMGHCCFMQDSNVGIRKTGSSKFFGLLSTLRIQPQKPKGVFL